jgi:DNA-binding LytR/AlgR family response regulator
METLENLKIHIGGRRSVCPHEVLMIQADLNYSIVHFLDGSTVMVATTLKKLEDRFKHTDFIRMNKTYMINRRYVISEEHNSMTMCNDLTVKFSRRKAKAWRDALWYS